MKPEEAIEVLNEILDVLGLSHCSNSSEYIAVDTAIQSLEKQIPMKPERIMQTLFVRGPEYICGCGAYIGYLHEYCNGCGQKLDWKEE